MGLLLTPLLPTVCKFEPAPPCAGRSGACFAEGGRGSRRRGAGPFYIHSTSGKIFTLPKSAQPQPDHHPMSEPAQKKEMAACPQCLLTQAIDCHEEDCPWVSDFVAAEKKGAAAPDLKMCLTMGLRIAALEREARESADLLVVG